MGKPDSRVPSSSFNNGSSRLDSEQADIVTDIVAVEEVHSQALLFRISNNAECSTILDATTRILELSLAINLGTYLF